MATIRTFTNDGRSHQLERVAASWFNRLNDAYRAKFGKELVIVDAGRTRAQQQALYNAYLAGRGNLAARPGTSVHESMRAIDFGYPCDRQSTAEHKWLVANAPRFGWWWAGGQSWWSQIEAWHFEFDGRNVGNKMPPTRAASTAVKHAEGKLVEDGILGPATINLWQKAAGRAQTGALGRDFVRWLQRHMNKKRPENKQLKVDGIFGRATILAVQEWINAPVKDGVFTPGGSTVRKLQKQLNDGTHSWA